MFFLVFAFVFYGATQLLRFFCAVLLNTVYEHKNKTVQLPEIK